MNDLFALNARAGKRITPYPGEGEPAPDPTCLACHADLSGQRGANGFQAVFCSDTCRKAHTSRLQYARMEAARQERRLGISPYNWN